MILSDHDILRALDSGRIDVEPSPDAVQIQPASLDVRLGECLYNVDEDFTVTTFAQRSRHNVTFATRTNAVDGFDDHVLQPDTRYLAHTKETVSLPDDVAAQLTGRSTIGRLGVIVHKTAGFIDPSFSGQIVLELMNFANEPVRLEVGKRVAQLVFFELSSPSSGYDGKYQNQSGVTEAVSDHE